MGKELEKVGNMERRRRTGGDGGDRGMEENTMALLDTSGFSNSKLSHHLNDDRAYIYICLTWFASHLHLKVSSFDFDGFSYVRACFSGSRSNCFSSSR